MKLQVFDALKLTRQSFAKPDASHAPWPNGVVLNYPNGVILNYSNGVVINYPNGVILNS